MDKNTRWVVLGFVGIGLLTAWVLGEGLQSLFYMLRRYGMRDMELLGSAFTLANLLGVVVTAIAGFVLWKNEGINRSSHEVVEELRKVTWPDSQDTQTSTIVVIVTTVIISAVLWTFDLLWAWLTSMIYGGQS